MAKPVVIPAPQGTHTENGLAGFAKLPCSGVFVSGRAPEDVVNGSAYRFGYVLSAASTRAR